MKILITGSNGFIGSHLSSFFLNYKHLVIQHLARFFNEICVFESNNFIQLDITDFENVKLAIKKSNPNVIVHCAAMSKPNDCELNNEKCYLTNYLATKNLVDSIKFSDTHFIFFSTDFVYGEGADCREETKPNPLNYYAKTKLLAEEFIKCNLTNYSIIRPVFVYGKKMSNANGGFIQWVHNNLQENKLIKVVNDQYRKPTYVNDVCEVVKKIIDKKLTGIFNVCGDQVLTPYKMALLIAEHFNFNTNNIEPVTANNFNEPALRAKECFVNNNKIKKLLNFKPSFLEQNIKSCFELV